MGDIEVGDRLVAHPVIPGKFAGDCNSCRYWCIFSKSVRTGAVVDWAMAFSVPVDVKLHVVGFKHIVAGHGTCMLMIHGMGQNRSNEHDQFLLARGALIGAADQASQDRNVTKKRYPGPVAP